MSNSAIRPSSAIVARQCGRLSERAKRLHQQHPAAGWHIARKVNNSSFGRTNRRRASRPPRRQPYTDARGRAAPAVFAALSNDASGAPIVAAAVLVNLGSATSAGVGTRRNLHAASRLESPGFYTGFHSSVNDLSESPLLPNTPGPSVQHRDGVRAGSHQRSMRYRWSTGSLVAGIMVVRVPSYGVLDLNGQLSAHQPHHSRADVAKSAR